MEKTEKTAIRWEKGQDNVVVLTLDDPDASANTMNALYVASMKATVARLEAEKNDIAGVIVTSAKKTFFAGGNLDDIMKVEPKDAQLFTDMVTEVKRQLRVLETLGKPVVAAINGAALGGGLEIALACHRRVAIDDGKSEIGLPEVTLGLLPGGGGIVRTVRLLGIQNALMNVLLQGQRMKPAKALAAGVVDELAKDAADMMAKARAFIAANPTSQQPWDKPGYKIPGGTPTTPAFAANLPAFPANLRKQTKGANYPAPRAIMCAAVEGAQVDIDAAMTIEGRWFTSLVVSREAKNMTKAFFFDLQAINAGGSRPKKDAHPPWKSKKVGVLGAGMMGQGIAYAAAMSGIEVVLLDASQEAAERGKAYTQKILEKRSTAKEKVEATLGLIRPTTKYEDLAGCDLVIEAVFEDRALKAEVTKKAEAHALPDALVASNTSTLPITGLAEASSRPNDFVGLHFFSPVDKMPLVEIIVGKKTSDAALAKAFDFVLQLRKTPIVVNDSRGFFTSRVFATYCSEGHAMLGEGFAPSSIEQAALQAGMPVGPLAVSDEVSLRLMQSVRKQTIADLAAEGKTYERSRAEEVVDELVALGRTGKKDGKGFYDYPEGGKKRLWPGLAERFGKAAHARPEGADFEEMKERLLYRQSIEAVRCLEEGVLRSIADANIGSIFGIGMAPWTGGVLQYVNYVGLRAFVARARELAKKHGPRFEPPKLLVERAEKNKPFV